MKVLALLGRRDEPTDGVADYCNYLAQALRRKNIELDIVRMPWAERGWSDAMRWLASESLNWHADWVLLQYTALSWSRHGFSVRAHAILKLLRQRGLRCAVVFHDAHPFEGTRLRDKVRQTIQNRTMLQLYRNSERSAFTVALKTAEWLPRDAPHAAFIPIGANIPTSSVHKTYRSTDSPKIVAVFSVTDGEPRVQESRDIVGAVKLVRERIGPVRLEVFGRGAVNAQKLLEERLGTSGIDLSVRGIIAAEEITRTLAAAHALLFVRGLTNSHRGTAIAGIACGLPVVGYGQPGTDPAIDMAGVCLAPWRDPQALAEALVAVLGNENLWHELHARNFKAHAEYFSWDAVAGRFAKLLADSAVSK